jgi:hypothetical protein
MLYYVERRGWGRFQSYVTSERAETAMDEWVARFYEERVDAGETAVLRRLAQEEREYERERAAERERWAGDLPF